MLPWTPLMQALLRQKPCCVHEQPWKRQDTISDQSYSEWSYQSSSAGFAQSFLVLTKFYHFDISDISRVYPLNALCGLQMDCSDGLGFQLQILFFSGCFSYLLLHWQSDWTALLEAVGLNIRDGTGSTFPCILTAVEGLNLQPDFFVYQMSISQSRFLEWLAPIIDSAVFGGVVYGKKLASQSCSERTSSQETARVVV